MMIQQSHVGEKFQNYCCRKFTSRFFWRFRD